MLNIKIISCLFVDSDKNEVKHSLHENFRVIVRLQTSHIVASEFDFYLVLHKFVLVSLD